MRRKKRRSEKRKNVQDQLEKGIASDYIRFLLELIAELGTLLVVLYCRESKDNGNLDDQVKEAIEELNNLGVVVIAVFKEVENGSIYNPDRTEFHKAIEFAKLHNAILVSPSRERKIRSHIYDGTAESDQPTVAEYKALLALADGVAIATILHPDEPGRSKETKRGQAAKGNKGGRPPKQKLKKKPNGRERREAYLPIVVRKHKAGYSLRDIANKLNAIEDEFPEICHKTISNWINEELKKT